MAINGITMGNGKTDGKWKNGKMTVYSYRGNILYWCPNRGFLKVPDNKSYDFELLYLMLMLRICVSS